ncbi:PQQ-dependent sugar dehydrogenase [Legionella londiniensis]|uniref:L-sorbosone dehydrogenase n=1 Tax=Legionella londiniensis TaxID=45068 RepID=A0A0W0VLQ8_9GAMM|nr:PQQ-dependent sugar dehydrogenase [Legionella londiniensis]KTD21028.1 L-sorbosone dehydrogenase [Legionella londiniensis]STX93697.1 L-sorbosone dehydrogenase [Legionella londiniensis]
MQKKKSSIFLIILFFLFVLAVSAYWFRDKIIPLFFQPTATSIQTGTKNPASSRVIAKELYVPWELVFLPDNDFLVTERRGNLKRLGKVRQTITIPDAYEIGEGGLLGMALDPEFSQNHYIYLYYTTRKANQLVNEVVRYTYNPKGNLENKTSILTNIPAARFHNGGRIKFGPDGYLYVTTGDALNPSLSQDKKSLAGKILRISRDGKPAPDNPFANRVYSLGHRNPQGLAWDAEGRLWASEHGESAHDEINLIIPGSNYGWPVIQGREEKKNMKSPMLTSGSQETWAPGGMAYLSGRLFFSGLRGQTLYEVHIAPRKTNIGNLKGHLRNKYGRIRNVVIGPDGFLYIMTSNRDGRGRPEPEDDRIIRLDPKSL